MDVKTFGFIVLGSKGDEYQIAIEVSPENLDSSCTCPAGSYRGICKHVIAILGGDGSSLKNPLQTESLDALTLSLSKHPVIKYIREWNEANKLLKDAERRVKIAKTSMLDFINPT
jgi:uncharacterized Zn finger protein